MALSRSRHVLVALAGLLGVTSVVTGLGAVGSGASAATPALVVSPAQPLPNEVVALRGVVGPAGRPVALQKYVGGRWAGVTSARTGSGGAYAFKVRATTSTTAYRVTSAKWKVKRTRYAAVTSRTTGVKGMAGSARLAVLPYPVGNRSVPALPVVATFKPPRPGKLVKVLNAAGETVTSAFQNADGTATASVPAGPAGSSQDLHAMTFPGNGAANYATVAVPATVTAATQTFDDEFDGSTLDTTKWGLRSEGYYGNRKCAKPSADQVTVGGGYVHLGVQRIPGLSKTTLENGSPATCKLGVWKNGVISTARSSSPFTQTNGVFAARVRLQAPRGMHGSFWLQGGGTGSAEADVFEHFGLGSGAGLTTKIHQPDQTGAIKTLTSPNLMSALRGRRVTDDNVFSVEWSPGLYVFRINGIETYRSTRQVSTTPAELVLSLMTSDWELPVLNAGQSFTVPTAKMHVDWVRAWS